MCTLLSERGLEATSPTMIFKRSGVGQGSMYHHFEGKNDLALAAIRQMRTRTLKVLNREPEEEGDETPEQEVSIDAALDDLFTRREGRALLRLLTDPTVADSTVLWTEVQAWCYEIRAFAYVSLGPEDDDERSDAEKLPEVGDPVLTAALGRALLNLAG